MSEWQFSSTLAVEDRKYLTFTQNLPDASSDLSCAAQKAKFSPDNDTVQLIGYGICVSDSTNNVNIMYRCNQTTRDVLSAEFYAMAHGFNIEKRNWGRYVIMQKKSCQHQDYGRGGT
ncbi:hypothetical protein MMC31_006818, partial [Peltigera leucophlebia]|nr:hypothetical protein [Peltigera leucophlebia]